MNGDYVEATRRYVFGTWRYQRTWKPKLIVEADGAYFTDADGKQIGRASCRERV